MFKNKNNKLMSFCIDDDDEVLEKYKIIWTKIEDLKIIKLNALLVYDERYIRTKTRTLVIKFILTFVVKIFQKMVYNNGFLLPFLLIFYLSLRTNIIIRYIYLDNCTCKTVNTQMIDYLDSLFEYDEN